MKVGVFGRGRLGSAIAAAAGADLAWCLGRTGVPGSPVGAAIDCSAASAVDGHLAWALETGTSFVIGTTGWSSGDLAARVGDRIGVVVAPNFSLTVALVARFATLLGRFAALDPSRDLYLQEHHHARKSDAPSGTAKLLAQRLLEACPRKTSWTLGGPVAPEQLSVAVLRAGATYSSHVIGLDAPAEVLEIHHHSRSAAAYAAGALAAATFAAEHRGVFTMESVASSVLDPLFQQPQSGDAP